MAFLYIAEFNKLQAVTTQPEDKTQAPAVPPIVEQKLAIGGELQSAPFNDLTRFIRLHTDAVCSVAFGVDPHATVNNMRLAANQTEFCGIFKGHRLSVIANT